MTDGERAFITRWNQVAHGLPAPENEYRFTKSRKWRLDFAWPSHMVAVEIDGGQWVAFGGRHSRDTDREKLNAAAAMGWRVLRYSPQMIDRDPLGVIEEVARAISIRQ